MNLEKRFSFFWHTHVAICTESQKARHFLSKHALFRADDSQTELHHLNQVRLVLNQRKKSFHQPSASTPNN